MGVQTSLSDNESFPLDKSPGVGLLDYMVVLFLILWGPSLLFSTGAAPIYVPTNSAQGFLSPHPGHHYLSFVFLILAILTGVSIDRWVDKEDMVYIYTMEYHSAIKNNDILPFAMMWMELECITLSEINRKKKSTIWFHSEVEFKRENEWTYGKGWRKRIKADKPRETLHHREQTEHWWREGGWGWAREMMGIRRALVVMSTACSM